MTEKSLIIKGPLDDLSDVLHIARIQAKIVLKVKRVKIKPVVYPYGNDYLVVVEPDGYGCSRESVVGSGKAKNK